MAPAGGDQLSAILGAWSDGWVPGIKTIDHIADDVHHEHLQLPFQDVEIDPAQMPGAFINSKGFGGNNATGFVLSPAFTLGMLAKRWGKAAVLSFATKQAAVEARAEEYDRSADSGAVEPIYMFGKGVVDGSDLSVDPQSIKIPGFPNPVRLDMENPYSDMTD
ncbi:MAG TPA: hypothetical protein DER02_05025 [Gammaproteobacteria bacterium]|nr:hypothetical protein [Gammaproteobacteria bacterium]